MATVTVLPSPLLPAVAYERLATALRRAGTETTTADPALTSGQTVVDLVERWAAAAARSDVLVAHSNAGLMAPLVRRRAGGRGRIVFMDAALLPEAGAAPLAPTALRETLATMTDARGVLPPWTRWWPPETLASVVPEDLVDDLDGGCPRLPASWFDQRLEAPDGWTREDNAYLAFGATYAAELAFAHERSWPAERLDGGHLHHLHEPDRVAERILDLARRLG